jgi:hypothetical protein
MTSLRNPFTDFFQAEDISVKEYADLIEIIRDSILEQKFPTISLSNFGLA